VACEILDTCDLLPAMWTMQSIVLVLSCLTCEIHCRRIQTSAQAESQRKLYDLQAVRTDRLKTSHSPAASVLHLRRTLARALQAEKTAAAFHPPARPALHGQVQMPEAQRGHRGHRSSSPVGSVSVEEDEDVLMRQLDEELAALESSGESSPLEPGDAPAQLVDVGSRSIPMLMPEQDALAEALIAKAHAIAIEDEDQYDEIMRLQMADMMGDEPAYWAQLWPCGVVLSKQLLERPSLVAGRAVLDLGAGLGLCSICAALAGAESVLATDCDTDACAFVAANAAENNVSDIVDTATLDWATPGALAGATFDTVCCSDVLYSEDAPKLIAPFLEQAVRSSGTVFLADNADRPYEGARRAELLQLLAATGKFEVLEQGTHNIELKTAQGSNFTVEMLALRRLSS